MEKLIDMSARPQMWRPEELFRHNGTARLAFSEEAVALRWDPRQLRDEYVTGLELMQRLEYKPALNATVMQWLLRHQERIPVSWRGKHVYFFGSVLWRGRLRDNYFVPYMAWAGESWFEHERWLGQNWTRDMPVAMLRNESAYNAPAPPKSKKFG